jgi:hypothetical protein
MSKETPEIKRLLSIADDLVADYDGLWDEVEQEDPDSDYQVVSRVGEILDSVKEELSV